MQYESVCRASFLARPNRFIALVELDGTVERVHVKNTGRCRELLLPGAELWLSRSDKPERKTNYDLIAVRKDDGVLFNIDSQAPNRVVREWLETQNYDRILPEQRFGSSRIDFAMERGGERWLLEVKGCTLERNGIGYFPDAPTVRGTRHLKELTQAVRQGWHAAVAFVMQAESMERVLPNRDTDPAFAEALCAAQDVGVQVLSLPCRVTPDRLELIGDQTFRSEGDS